MFQLTLNEAKELYASRSQIATLKRGGNIKYAPYVLWNPGTGILVKLPPFTIQKLKHLHETCENTNELNRGS